MPKKYNKYYKKNMKIQIMHLIIRQNKQKNDSSFMKKVEKTLTNAKLYDKISLFITKILR